jgi:hypothetical protein
VHQFGEDLVGGVAIGVENGHERTHRNTGDRLDGDVQLMNGVENANVTESFDTTSTENKLNP